jgi:uncharacterized repeat protein (TIGR01451 family)
MKFLFRLLITIVFFITIFKSQIYAQVSVNESFKTDVAGGNIVLGGNAYLTAGAGDPPNEGWLRLNNCSDFQKGYAYINTSFPSTLGVQIDFEYKTWRTNTGDVGGDGFTVYFFDASVSFAMGGYGGSLGYAPNTGDNIKTGLAGGYVGIGFDEYGNFSNGDQGRIGGPGQRPNSITLRGPTTNDPLTTNVFLSSVQLQPDPNSDINSIDYNTPTFERPSESEFYRRVKISIIPLNTEDGQKYKITVKWRTSPSGNDVTLISYTTTTPPPANLKMGFGSSTGGSKNYHEIRNLVVSTPGGVAVEKEVDKANAKSGDKVTYKINVHNYTTAPISNLLLTDTLKDGKGNIIDVENSDVFTLTVSC